MQENEFTYTGLKMYSSARWRRNSHAFNYEDFVGQKKKWNEVLFESPNASHRLLNRTAESKARVALPFKRGHALYVLGVCPLVSLLSSVAERWSCKPAVVSSILTGGKFFFLLEISIFSLQFYYFHIFSIVRTIYVIYKHILKVGDAWTGI